VIADRFHVAKLYREGLDALRKKEMKRLKRELPEADSQRLKNVMWLLRKPFDELTSDEQRILNRLFHHSPKLRQAYDLCAALTAIYNSPLSKGQAKGVGA
jgi:transposase